MTIKYTAGKSTKIYGFFKSPKNRVDMFEDIISDQLK